ncbi:hypothetical protein KAU37_01660 [Candidatus Bipolaricaulota bacterium]|nr:hypothetical protein [Candidatus Bipolaricaulota bacterium]
MGKKMLSLIVHLSVVLMVVGLVVNSQVAREVPFEVVSVFLSPGPSPQDLAWDGETLWVVDDLTNTLYQIDPSKGEVLFDLSLRHIEGMPDVVPGGLAWLDPYLMVADAKALILYEVDPSDRTLVSVFPLLEFQRAEGVRSIALTESRLSGLTSDGKRLWATFIAGYSSSIYRINYYEGLFIDHFWAPGHTPMDLAWVNRSLWVVDGVHPGRIYQLTAEGKPTGAYIPSPGPSPSGLAFDGTYLWVADREEQSLFRILIQD